MKRFLIIVLVVLAACTVYRSEFDEATELCAPNGGLISLNTNGNLVKCGNGARFYL